jgi:hypothetical protein
VTRTFRRRRLPNARPSSSKTNPRTHSPEQIAQISAFHGRLRSTARKDHPHRPTGRKRVHGYGPVREVRAEDRDHRARRERHRQRITRRVQYSPAAITGAFTEFCKLPDTETCPSTTSAWSVFGHAAGTVSRAPREVRRFCLTPSCGPCILERAQSAISIAAPSLLAGAIATKQESIHARIFSRG